MAKTKRAVKGAAKGPDAAAKDADQDVDETDDAAPDTTDADDDAQDAADIDEDDDDEDDDDEVVRLKPKPKRRKPLPWRRYARAGLVAAVFAGAFGITGFLGWKLWEQHSVNRAGETARQAAISYAQVLTSIDSNQVDQNFAAVLNGATGGFKDTYASASMQLREFLLDYRATAQGVVTESAIQSESKDQVVVLLMVNQSVTNTARPDPRIDQLRMKMTMQNVDGRWLASKVELP